MVSLGLAYLKHPYEVRASIPPTRPEKPVMPGTDAEVVVMNVDELLTIDEVLKDEKLVGLMKDVLGNTVDEESVVGLIEEVNDEVLEEKREELFSEETVDV